MISLVLPTYNRAAALRETLPCLLGLEAVGELVVVDDASTDATADLLGAVADPRLRVLRAARNVGAPSARNAGADAARGEWVLFAEDDCFFPVDFARVLWQEARAHGADVVGAPMVHLRGRGLEVALATARARGGGDGGLDAVAGFPPAALVTPLLPAPSLARRELVRALRFDAGYGGNAYREETDFFLRAASAGARCLLTPRTYFWERERWGGGNPRGLRGELWTVRNNWRFLRRHRAWLSGQGHISTPARAQAAFVGRRLRGLAP